MQKVADASGAKYSAASAAPPPAATRPPAAASKPVFIPTRTGPGGSFNPLVGSSRSRDAQRSSNADEDGWGADAPPVVRSQLEKVAPAYQPTKVNMAELTKQKEPSRFSGNERDNGRANSGDVVRGGYQPVGKVDIAAIRAQAKNTQDDRPTTVKGAYEPVGKVDIAAIRAKAQKPSDKPRVSTAETGGPASDGQPKSLAERSAAFSASERLTTLPKPKVANKFGSSAAFTGTKAPTPGAFGLQSPPTTSSPPIGAASRTFADEGGKTPAQIWAEKKARERGLSGAADTSLSITSPIKSQTSGGGEWKSGYVGKTWAPVATTTTGRSAGSVDQQRTGEDEHEQGEATTSSAGGVGALRDRFKGGAPMGQPSSIGASSPPASGGDDAPPLPSSRPQVGIPMPGLPTRPRTSDDDEQEGPNIPPPPAIQRSPSPEREPSPVRIAMPVARSKQPELEAAEEPPFIPARAIEERIQHEDDDEPAAHDPARAAGAAVATASFGQEAVGHSASSAGGKRAIAQYDYEKAEDNEIELVEGQYVTNIEMVDEDWWMGTNEKGESGLFPSNYVELVEDGDATAPAAREPEPEPEPAPAPAARPVAPAAAPAGPTATAAYDYEAAEDNELSFPEGAKITGLVSFLVNTLA